MSDSGLLALETVMLSREILLFYKNKYPTNDIKSAPIRGHFCVLM
jgi:hypothetical protein